MHTDGEPDYYKSAYWGVLSVGTPLVPYKFVFDTGSGHFIVPSTYCRSETCRAHKRYSRKASSSARDIDHDGTTVMPGKPRDQITVSFGTGEVTGVFVEDEVCLGEAPPTAQPRGAHAAALICTRMRVVAAVDMSKEPFGTFGFDGVLGLGLDPLSQAPDLNLMSVMAGDLHNKGSTRPHTFAVFLAEREGETSEITFGGWNEQRFEDAELAWNPVLDPELGHWIVRIKAIKVDDDPVAFCQDGSCKGVVDTGTSLVVVPTPSFQELYEMLRHPADLSGLCREGGPRLHIVLEDNFTLVLGPEDYARPERSGSASTAPSWPSSELKVWDDVYCKPMLMAMDPPAPVGPKLFILGEPVLRKYYTVYNRRTRSIGFGRAVHQGRPASCREAACGADD